MTLPGSRSWSPSARRTVAVVIAFAVVLGAIEAFSFHIWKSRGPYPLSWPEAMTRTVPSWLVIAAMAWPVRLLAKRFRFRR